MRSSASLRQRAISLFENADHSLDARLRLLRRRIKPVGLHQTHLLERVYPPAQGLQMDYLR
ncbi:MAG: hypothetical protein IPJ30_14195 [Acidobacteria bacterium]|nr:hypothetical protein [Acidobacteriota bacterium]